MGKFATYRKRGSHHGTSLPAPPAPVLELDIVHDVLLCHATGLDDIGGHYAYRTSHTPGGPIIDEVTANWDNTDTEDLEIWESGDYVHAVEQGNGITYAGESTRSNEVQIP